MKELKNSRRLHGFRVSEFVFDVFNGFQDLQCAGVIFLNFLFCLGVCLCLFQQTHHAALYTQVPAQKHPVIDVRTDLVNGSVADEVSVEVGWFGDIFEYVYLE